MLGRILYRRYQGRAWLPSWAAPHSVFRNLRPWRGVAPAGFEPSFVGQMIDVGFVDGWAIDNRLRERPCVTCYPMASDELFEWIALISAIKEARERFVMIEGGAGYGRWLVAAAKVLEQLRPELPYLLIGVEAEPTHFGWMRKHFLDNGIDPDAHRLIRAAISDEDGSVSFTVGDAAKWYGQAIVDSGDPGYTKETVPAVSIDTLLAGVDHVDFLDFDIQGAEGAAITAGIGTMTRKVRRAYIGTHSEEIEASLAACFPAHAWRPIDTYSLSKRQATPYGQILFGDGVHHWINPAL